MRWRTIVLPVAALVVGLTPGISRAHTEPLPGPPIPYHPPAFADECEWQRYGEGEAPDFSHEGGEDPLCVEYAKRDITVDNGGAVAFALAEPARVALAAPVCRYWQRDHWSVQFSRGDVPVVRWDGSYWFDKSTGEAAGRLRNLTVGGQPAGLEEAARLVEHVSPELAAYLRGYARGGSGLGAELGVPLDPTCDR